MHAVNVSHQCLLGFGVCYVLVGKSTTLHFLAGVPFQKVKCGVHGQYHLAPAINVKDGGETAGALQSVVTSPSGTSETKTINAVSIPYKGGTVILCDTPGFKDNGAPEVEVANNISLSRSLQRCRSILPVVLLCPQTFLARGDGVVEQIDMYIELFESIEQHLDSFSFIMTRTDETTFDNVPADFRNKASALKNSGRSLRDIESKMMNKIASDIQSSGTSGGAIFPLKGGHARILDQILSKTPIENPDTVVKEFTTSHLISDQLLKIEMSIRNCLGRRDADSVALLSFNMNNLKALDEHTRLQLCHDKYIDCLKLFYAHVESEFTEGIDILKALHRERSSSIANLKEQMLVGLVHLERVCALESIRESHIFDGSRFGITCLSEAIAAALEHQQSSVVRMIKVPTEILSDKSHLANDYNGESSAVPRNTDDWAMQQQLLDWMCALSDIVHANGVLQFNNKANIKSCYLEGCKVMGKWFHEYLLRAAVARIEERDYLGAVNLLDDIKRSVTLYSRHIDISGINAETGASDLYTTLVVSLANAMQCHTNEACSIIAHDEQLSSGDVGVVNSILTKLTALLAWRGSRHVKDNILTKMQHTICVACQEYVSNAFVVLDVKDDLELTENVFPNMSKHLARIVMLQNANELIKTSIAESYSAGFKKFNSTISRLRNTAYDLRDKLFDDPLCFSSDVVNVQNLSATLMLMFHASLISGDDFCAACGMIQTKVISFCQMLLNDSSASKDHAFRFQRNITFGITDYDNVRSFAANMLISDMCQRIFDIRDVVDVKDRTSSDHISVGYISSRKLRDDIVYHAQQVCQSRAQVKNTINDAFMLLNTLNSDAKSLDDVFSCVMFVLAGASKFSYYGGTIFVSVAGAESDSQAANNLLLTSVKTLLCQHLGHKHKELQHKLGDYKELSLRPMTSDIVAELAAGLDYLRRFRDCMGKIVHECRMWNCPAVTATFDDMLVDIDMVKEHIHDLPFLEKKLLTCENKSDIYALWLVWTSCSFAKLYQSIVLCVESHDTRSMRQNKDVVAPLLPLDEYLPEPVYSKLLKEVTSAINDAESSVETLILIGEFTPQLCERLANLEHNSYRNKMFGLLDSVLEKILNHSVLNRLEACNSGRISRGSSLWADIHRLHSAEVYFLEEFKADPRCGTLRGMGTRVSEVMDELCEQYANDYEIENCVDKYDFVGAQKNLDDCQSLLNVINSLDFSVPKHDGDCDVEGVPCRVGVISRNVQKFAEAIQEYIRRCEDMISRWFDTQFLNYKVACKSNDVDTVKYFFPPDVLLEALERASRAGKPASRALYSERYEQTRNNAKRIVKNALSRIYSSCCGFMKGDKAFALLSGSWEEGTVASNRDANDDYLFLVNGSDAPVKVKKLKMLEIPTDEEMGEMGELPTLAECEDLIAAFDASLLTRTMYRELSGEIKQVRNRLKTVKDKNYRRREKDNSVEGLIRGYFQFEQCRDSENSAAAQNAIQKEYERLLTLVKSDSTSLFQNIATIKPDIVLWKRYADECSDCLDSLALMNALIAKIDKVTKSFTMKEAVLIDLLAIVELFSAPSEECKTICTWLSEGCLSGEARRIENDAKLVLKDAVECVRQAIEVAEEGSNLIRTKIAITQSADIVNKDGSVKLPSGALDAMNYLHMNLSCLDALYAFAAAHPNLDASLTIQNGLPMIEDIRDPVGSLNEDIGNLRNQQTLLFSISFGEQCGENIASKSGQSRGQLLLEKLARAFSNAYRACDSVIGISDYLKDESANTPNSTDRDIFYARLNVCLTLRLHGLEFLNKNPHLDNCIPENSIGLLQHVSQQVDDMAVKMLAVIDQILLSLDNKKRSITISERDAMMKAFSLMCDHLRAIGEYITTAKGISSKVKETLELVRQDFESKVCDFKQGFRISPTLFETENCQKLFEKVNPVCSSLVLLKSIGLGLPVFKDFIDCCIDEVFDYLTTQGTLGKQFIGRIGANLKTRHGALGNMMIRDHPLLKPFSEYLQNDRLARMTIEQMVELVDHRRVDRPKALRGVDLDTENLVDAYHTFQDIYNPLVEQGLDPDTRESFLQSVVIEARETAKSFSSKLVDTDEVVKLIALVCVSWTISLAASYDVVVKNGIHMSSDAFSDSRKFLRRPHVGQVLTLLRLFNLGRADNSCRQDPSFFSMIASAVSTIFTPPTEKIHLKVSNHFVQLGTGEGKSVVLAIASIVLALSGYSVDCACYSEYLSKRDYDDFHFLFQRFRVEKHITYGTFNVICENFLNSLGDIRANVCSLVESGQTLTKINHGRSSGKKGSARSSRGVISNVRPRVLIIDEVDVFFSPQFYGRPYNPLARLRSFEVSDLIKHLWSISKKFSSLDGSGIRRQITAQIKESAQFNICLQKYSKWGDLLHECVKSMVGDLLTFESHEYKVENGRITYKDNDRRTDKICVGYKTMFAYFKHFDTGEIDATALEDSICLFINCGAFAYSEIPKLYTNVLGVTGTLETLNDPEKQVLENDYHVNMSTIMPSVYGDRRLRFQCNSSDDLIILRPEVYSTEIGLVKEIKKRMIGQNSQPRPVLVFFENLRLMEEFRGCSAFRSLRDNALTLTEETDNRQDVIRRAIEPGRVTLLTQELGRGTDFVIFSDEVRAAGGVHVIQTFVAEDLSCETQIQGRAARQGEDGSFSMVILSTDLEKYGIEGDQIQTLIDGAQMYNEIDNKRRHQFAANYATRTQFVEDVAKLHAKSQKFLEGLLTNCKLRELPEFILKMNKCSVAYDGGVYSQTYCLIDGTFSMNDTFVATKATVMRMFTDVQTTLEQQGVAGAFEMQIGIYRNYNAPASLLFEHSAWESSPQNLQAFMEPQRVQYGMGNEAIEVALQHVNKHFSPKMDIIPQVILIGDAPPNTADEVTQKRRPNGRWSGTEFEIATTCDDELQALVQKGIQVHTFYVRQGARIAFERIASATSGVCSELDVRGSEGANKLKEEVVKKVLEDIGNNSGFGGRQLVSKYEELLHSGYIS